jgi:peroxiredoxin
MLGEDGRSITFKSCPYVFRVRRCAMGMMRGRDLMRVLGFFLFIQLAMTGPGAVWAAEKKMPAFSLLGLGDSVERVSSEKYEGKVVLVNFWATWCPPCRREIPSLIRLHDENRDNGFTVIGISMDKGDRSKISDFVKRIGINYPVALGTPEVARSFGAMGTIPATFLIDRQGRIVRKYPGYTTYEKMAKDLKELMD